MKKRKKTERYPHVVRLLQPSGVPGHSRLVSFHIPVGGPMCGYCGWHGLVGDEGQCVAVGDGEFEFRAHPHT